METKCNFKDWNKVRKPYVPAPTYGDLGKAARDLFSEGYHFGLVNVDFKTKIEDSVEVKAGGSLCTETDVFSGNMATSYKMKDQGLNFTEKWTTDNTLGTEISLENKLAEGLKIGLDSTFSAKTGDKSCKVKGQYRTDKVALTMDVDVPPDGPIIGGSATLVLDSWLVGYQMAFDANNNEISKNNFAFGYIIDDFALHSSVNNLEEFTGSVYRKVDPKLEIGVQMTWLNDGSNEANLGLACKYNLAENVTLRAKVDETCGIGLSFQKKIREGVTCTMSALINGKNINEGGHKIGMALDLEA